jgi:hypothetical protein
MGMGIVATAVPKYAVPDDTPIDAPLRVAIKNSVENSRVAVFKGFGEEREMIAQGLTNVEGLAEFFLDRSLIGEEVQVVIRKPGILPVSMSDLQVGSDGLEVQMVAVEDRAYLGPDHHTRNEKEENRVVVDTFGLPFSLIPPWRRT